VVFGIAAILLARQPNGLVGLLRFDWARLAEQSAWRRARWAGADRHRPRTPAPAGAD